MSTSARNDEANDVDDPSGTTTSRQKGRSGTIKNKIKRQLLYRREKLRKGKERRERKENRKRKAEELGEEVNDYKTISWNMTMCCCRRLQSRSHVQ